MSENTRGHKHNVKQWNAWFSSTMSENTWTQASRNSKTPHSSSLAPRKHGETVKHLTQLYCVWNRMRNSNSEIGFEIVKRASRSHCDWNTRTTQMPQETLKHLPQIRQVVNINTSENIGTTDLGLLCLKYQCTEIRHEIVKYVYGCWKRWNYWPRSLVSEIPVHRNTPRSSGIRIRLLE